MTEAQGDNCVADLDNKYCRTNAQKERSLRKNNEIDELSVVFDLLINLL